MNDATPIALIDGIETTINQVNMVSLGQSSHLRDEHP